MTTLDKFIETVLTLLIAVAIIGNNLVLWGALTGKLDGWSHSSLEGLGILLTLVVVMDCCIAFQICKSLYELFKGRVKQ